jgi:hypothetical protein
VTTPSLQSSTGLSISIFEPTIDPSTPSYVPDGNLVDDLIAQKATGYSHTISAFGGYDRASININYNLVNAEDWIDRVGYHVEVWSPSLEKIWEGFINKITITAGSLSVTRGPLMDIGNRVRVVYSTVDSSISPPVVGSRARTADATATLSQNRYGVIARGVSVGGVSPANAVILRDSWIEENSLPETGKSFNSGSQSSANVTLEILGYFHWLKLFMYNDTTFGTREISLIIQDVFAEEAANINGLYSTDMTGITTPAAPISIKRYINKDLTALARIKFCVSYGDATFVRYLFGIYSDRKPFYYSIPTTIEYHQNITSPRSSIISNDVEIKPWNVLPGKYVQFDDFLVGAFVPDDFREDPRVGFIESVTYTAPYGLSWSGNKVSTVRQKLARMGLAGAGV